MGEVIHVAVPHARPRLVYAAPEPAPDPVAQATEDATLAAGLQRHDEDQRLERDKLVAQLDRQTAVIAGLKAAIAFGTLPTLAAGVMLGWWGRALVGWASAWVLGGGR